MENFYNLFDKIRRGENININELKRNYDANRKERNELRKKANDEDEDSGNSNNSSTATFEANLESRLGTTAKIELTARDISSLPIKFKCSLCEKSYSDETDLLLHIRGIHDVDSNQEALRSFRYLCPVCTRAFTHTDDLLSHISSIHRRHILDGQHRVICPDCDRDFSTRFKFEAHGCIRGTQGFPCEICGKRFSSQDAARRHCASRLRDKPFVCQQCGQRFRDYKQMWVHGIGHRHK